MPPDQAVAPYLDALEAYAARRPGRLHVPGHKGGPGADPGLRAAIGDGALALDIPALTQGIDVGPEPTPFELAQAMAAATWLPCEAPLMRNQGRLAPHAPAAMAGARSKGGGSGPAPMPCAGPGSAR